VIDRLASVGHRAGTDEVYQARVQGLGTNAKVIAIPECGADEVRQRADTHLQAGAIGHHVRDDAADHLVLGGGPEAGPLSRLRFHRVVDWHGIRILARHSRTTKSLRIPVDWTNWACVLPLMI
jgi:hypothetical protein